MNIVGKSLLAVAAALIVAQSGVASAKPDLSAVLNTRCTYPQVVAALNATSPQAAQKLNTSPIAQGFIQNYLSAPIPQREDMLQQALASKHASKYIAIVSTVAKTCETY